MKAKQDINSTTNAGEPTPEPVNLPSPLPSIETLAMIAANVSAGKECEPGPLIDYAFRLWIGAREKLCEENRDNNSVQTYDTAMDEWSKNISLPEQFPATFDQFLASVVAAKVPADSMKRFREFLRERVKGEGALELLKEFRSMRFTYDLWVEWAEPYRKWWGKQKSKIAQKNQKKRRKRKK
jgi:hypothetical protein